jgi:hypothetical protein
MKHKLMFSSLLLLALAPAAYASTTWYVNGVNGNDTNNCMSPATPCKTIGHAILLASSGDTIMVASATYTEHLTIRISLHLLGFSASTTIIDGGGVNRVVTISNSARPSYSFTTDHSPWLRAEWRGHLQQRDADNQPLRH